MSDADLSEKPLSSRTVYQGRLLDVREDRVRLPNGKESGREYIVHPGAVAVVPLLDDGSVLLERQHRYPLRRDVIEIPAGKLDAGEAALACGQRELVEETGFEAAEWTPLVTMHPCIAYSDEAIAIFLARGLRHVGHRRDEDEFLELLSLPFAAALEWVRDGRISDSKTLVGLLWADKWLRGEWAS